MERDQFEEVMDMFIKHGGEVLFTRKRIGGRISNYFILDESFKAGASVIKKPLAELLGQ
ncbi:MAG: hypothetical protein R2741_01110 [Methanolobus sp.]